MSLAVELDEQDDPTMIGTGLALAIKETAAHRQGYAVMVQLTDQPIEDLYAEAAVGTDSYDIGDTQR